MMILIYIMRVTKGSVVMLTKYWGNTEDCHSYQLDGEDLEDDHDNHDEDEDQYDDYDDYGDD